MESLDYVHHNQDNYMRGRDVQDNQSSQRDEQRTNAVGVNLKSMGEMSFKISSGLRGRERTGLLD